MLNDFTHESRAQRKEVQDLKRLRTMDVAKRGISRRASGPVSSGAGNGPDQKTWRTRDDTIHAGVLEQNRAQNVCQSF